MSSIIELIELTRINRRSPDFRFRSAGIDPGHKADLARAIIGLGGIALDPVLLWQDPDKGTDAKLQVLDGIHRVAAYHAVSWTKPIPAVIVSGDRRAALATALAGNAKHVLPLPQIDRLNAAWRLVRELVEPRFKVAEVARLASVSTRVVDKMRGRWRAMREAGEVPSGDWARDQHETQNEPEEDQQMTDKARTQAIEKLCKEIRDMLDRRKRPDTPILRDSTAVDEAILLALGDNRFKSIAGYFFGEVAAEWADGALSDHTAGSDYESNEVGKAIVPAF